MNCYLMKATIRAYMHAPTLDAAQEQMAVECEPHELTDIEVESVEEIMPSTTEWVQPGDEVPGPEAAR